MTTFFTVTGAQTFFTVTGAQFFTVKGAQAFFTVTGAHPFELKDDLTLVKRAASQLPVKLYITRFLE